MFHVFYVPAQKENKIAEKIKFFLGDKVKVHKFETRENKPKNILKFITKNLFPSYLVVETEHWQDYFYYKIKSAGAIKHLGEISEQEFLKMKQMEGTYISKPRHIKTKAELKIFIAKIKSELSSLKSSFCKYLKSLNQIFLSNPVDPVLPLIKKPIIINLEE